MSEQLQQIAMRMQDLREISGYSVEALAGEIGVTPQELRQYEAGTADIPVSVLYAVANKLNVELSTLVTGEEPKLSIYCLVRSGEGKAVARAEAYTHLSLADNFLHKKAEPMIVIVPYFPPEVPVHFNRHKGQEFNYVLEGRMKFSIHNKEFIMHPGDSIYFDSSYPHIMQALDGKPGKFLCFITE
ncbi:MAG: helix-turn-helix domain-containing protein [Christensenellales bacterium]|jgi:transcriptional regulator with XRE-family HTH domain